MGLDLHERRLVGGRWVDDVTDPAKAERWQVDADTDYAQKALNDWAEANPDEAPHSLLTVKLGSGDERADARQEIVDAFRRQGLEPPPLPD